MTASTGDDQKHEDGQQQEKCERRWALPFAQSYAGAGLYLRETISPDGETVYWLWDSNAKVDFGTWTPRMAPHEMTGPLPGGWFQRIGLVCGAETRAGTTCRHIVRSGGRCYQHGGER